MSAGPSFPVRTLSDCRLVAPGPSLAWTPIELAEVPWFGRVGLPTPTPRCRTLGGWDEWPGPEDDAVLQLALHGQEFLDALEAGGAGRVFTGVRDLVVELASRNRDAPGDAWDPRSQCIWDAAYCAGMMAGFDALGWYAPDDLLESWAWFAHGHWVAGYAADPHAGPQLLLIY